MEEKGFKEIVVPFKEEVEKRGVEKVCKQLELGIRAIVKEFYANLGDRKNLICYVRGRCAISQLLRLRIGSDCIEYEQLKKSPNFEEIREAKGNGRRPRRSQPHS